MKVKDLVKVIIPKESLTFEVYNREEVEVESIAELCELEPYLEEEIDKLDIGIHEIIIYLK